MISHLHRDLNMNHEFGTSIAGDYLQTHVDPVDVIFADPPFNIGEPYAGHMDNMSPQQFEQFTAQWFEKALHDLKPQGSMFIAVPDDMVLQIELLRSVNHLTRINWLIWHYRFGPHMKGRFIPSHVHIFWLSRLAMKDVYFNFEAVMERSDRASKYYDSRTWCKGLTTPGMRPPFDVWEFPRVVGNSKARVPECPNQMPREIIARCVLAATPKGGVVLDPFLGSGTTGSVCEQVKVRWVGIDKGSIDAADRRIIRDKARDFADLEGTGEETDRGSPGIPQPQVPKA